MLKWKKKKAILGYFGYLSGFESPLMHISKDEENQKLGFILRSWNLPFTIDEVYHKNLNEAKAYAEEVLRDYVSKLNKLMKNQDN